MNSHVKKRNLNEDEKKNDGKLSPDYTSDEG